MLSAFAENRMSYTSELCGAGWTCSACRAWVPAGMDHVCVTATRSYYVCRRCGLLVPCGEDHSCPADIKFSTTKAHICKDGTLLYDYEAGWEYYPFCGEKL